MRKIFTVDVLMNGNKRRVDLACDFVAISITVEVLGGPKKTYFGSDFYKCFAALRQDNDGLVFYCKGAKTNVHPSSMSSQMSLGLKAYELVIGKEPSIDDLVFIFDYEEKDLSNDPDEQRQFFLSWMTS
ncbi:hypothetical protein QZR14_22820 [Pseudomonas sp. rhizo66]|uniref:hypothetical protein n=1 Tax=Pseudomonas sp. rhizo66 TaxID=3059674 RepID=UPI00288D57E9|nr:hypothetical protein [Pseudomonas sp. rhizo66]MDT3314204.1 hypothetical protein [Pseudomonas sp. rhizo66]